MSLKCSEYAQMWRAARPLAAEAHRLLWIAIRKGYLPHPRRAGPCVDCGARATCYDHRDYTKPLEVEPVCLGCNRRRGTAHPYQAAPSVTGGNQRKPRLHHVMRAFADRPAA